MPDFHREDDWWRNGQNLYLDNLEATGLYQVPLSAAQPGDVLLCCFGSSVPNHAAIYCGDSELLHHIPEQLSKRERYTDKWQRRTLPSGVTGHGTHLPLRGFTTIWPPHRPRENGAEAIRALAMQLPAFRQKLSDGWYQVRIAGRDAGETELTARLNEPLANGAVIHIVPASPGPKVAVYFRWCWGGADCGGMVEPCGLAGCRGCIGHVCGRGQYDLGGVAQMLAPKARTPTAQVQITANRTPISPHWITWLPGQCSARSVR